MDMSAIFARFVALIGAVALLWRRLQGSAPAPAWGNAPAIPEAKPQGAIPTLKMPTAQGWSEGQKPTAAPGLKVNAFARDLDHPRWINVMPNGDVLIAEATQIAGKPRSVFHYAMQATMRRAAALGVSADRVTLLRDRDGSVSKTWKAKLLPASYLIGRDGRIRFVAYGELDWSSDAVRARVAELLQ